MPVVELQSGEWAGHYEQQGQLYPQRLRLELADGIARGGGIDTLGTFTVEGEYRAAPEGLRIGWIKTYDGAHSIVYLGLRQSDGSITGEWSIERTWRGSFRIAPVERTDELGAE